MARVSSQPTPTEGLLRYRLPIDITGGEPASISIPELIVLCLASATLTGVPTAPTPADGSNDDSVANAAFVVSAVSDFLSQTQIESLGYQTSAQVTAAITAAINNFLTQTQIEALGYRTAAQVTAAITAGDFLSDGGPWSASTSHARLKVVRHSGASYVALQNVPANTATTTEPGVGSQWETYWARLGITDPPGDSLTGLSFSGNILTANRRSGANPVQVNIGGLIADSGRGLDLIGFWRNSVTAANGNTLATGITLPTNPADDKLYFISGLWAAIDSEHTSTNGVIDGRTIKALPTLAVGASTGGTRILSEGFSSTQLLAGKNSDGELLLRNSAGSWDATTDFFALFDPDGEALSGVIAAAKYQLNDVASTSLGTSYTEIFFDIDTDSNTFNVGGVTVNTDGRIVIPADGLYHIETALHLVDPNPSGGGDGRRTIYSRSRAMRGTSQVPNTESLATSYMRGSSDSFEISVEHNDWEMLHRGDVLIVDLRAESSARNYEVDGATSFVSIVGFGITDRTPRLSPSISDFSLEGDLSPSAGAVDEMYQYSFAVAQSSHLSALRIVGFAGTSATPTAVSLLATIAAADYHGGSGSIRVQGFSLAANETYTVRLEAYEEGQTPATDQPVSYHDVRITAHATNAQTRFIRVQKRINNARPTASNLIANASVIATAGSVLGDWLVSGIPNDGNDWLVGWIVPQNSTQPNHYTSGGLNIDRAVAARFGLVENSVNYWVYLFTDAADADDSYNGTTITVS